MSPSASRLAVLVAASALAACSLAISTSGLSGGREDLASDAGDGAVVDAPTDARRDDGGTANPDAADAADARVPNLVAEYSFEDPDGTTARDSSGNARDAALVGGASFVADGVRGRALAVHGADFVSNNALSGAAFPRSGTLSLWFRYSFPPTDPTGRGIFDDYDNTRAHVFVRRIDGSTTGSFQIGLQPVDNAGNYAFGCAIMATQNQWTHVVVTWDEASAIGAGYLSGALVRQAAYALPFVPTSQNFRLGQGLAGAIDEVRLYDRALNPSEVAALQ